MDVTVQVSRRSPLVRQALVACTLLIGYLSLYPFEGWRDPGVAALGFLHGVGLKQLFWLDITLNVLGYLPFGMLAAMALPAGQGRLRVPIVLVAGTVLSATFEALQLWLPTRVSSRVDLMANAAGALAGALVGLWLLPRLERVGGIAVWRDRWFRRGGQADLGLLMLVLWPLTQCRPGSPFLDVGDLRHLLPAQAVPLYPADLFALIEALAAAAHVLVLGLMAQLVSAPGRSGARLLAGLIGGALALRWLGLQAFDGAGSLAGQFSPGGVAGLLLGTGLSIGLWRLSRQRQLAVAMTVLVLVTVLLNLAPWNPYLVEPVPGRLQGYLLSLHGLAGLLGALWPVLVAVWLVRASRHPV